MTSLCKKCSFRRYFLPTLGVIGLMVFDAVRNFFYLPIVFTYAAFILFWNFPVLIYFTHSKPLFVDDLFIDFSKLPNYNVNPEIKRKFLSILNWTLIVANSLFIGALADFWFYKTHRLTSLMEIVGVTGGIFKFFQIFNSIITGCVLYILQRYIINEHKSIQHNKPEQNEPEQNESRQIELTVLNSEKKPQIEPLNNKIIFTNPMISELRNRTPPSKETSSITNI